MRCLQFAPCLVWLAVAAGCAGDSDDASGAGGDRLHWDQAEASRDRLSRYSFLLYVDNARTTLGGAQCSQQATAAGYACSAPLPSLSAGPHTLELQAVVDGREGPRSAPVTVTIEGGRSLAETTAPATQSESTHPPAAAAIGDALQAASTSAVCSVETGGACFDAQVLLTSGAAIASPAALPDGRVLFIEGGRAVRVLRGTSLLDEPALVVQAPERLVALSVDPRFHETRFVWLASVAEGAGDRRTVTVTRYREVGDRFAEAAAVVADLPIPESGEPQMAQDLQRRLYLSIPLASVSRGTPASYAGRILRFMADGTIPWDSGQTSAVFAESPGLVSSLGWDSNGERLWVTAVAYDGRAALWSFATGETGLPQASAAGIPAGAGLEGARAIAALRADAPPARGELLLVDTSGSVWVAESPEAGVLTRASRLGLAGRFSGLAAGLTSAALLVDAPAGLKGEAAAEYKLIRLRRLAEQ